MEVILLVMRRFIKGSFQMGLKLIKIEREKLNFSKKAQKCKARARE